MQYFDRKILEYTSITNILSIFVIDVYSSQMEKIYRKIGWWTIFENEVKIVMKAEYKAENINATELLLRHAEPEKFILPKEYTNDFGDVGYDSKSMKVFESYDLVGAPASYGHIIHINGQSVIKFIMHHLSYS